MSGESTQFPEKSRSQRVRAFLVVSKGKSRFANLVVSSGKRGYISADELLELADESLEAERLKIWIILDRLDVAFAESAKLEGNALRALFRVYRDMAALENLSLKIFLRNDIWIRITSVGFREASHITKSITITWEPQALLNLVIRRASAQQCIAGILWCRRRSNTGECRSTEGIVLSYFPCTG